MGRGYHPLQGLINCQGLDSDWFSTCTQQVGLDYADVIDFQININMII
jgi:hypothetical protein